MQQNCNRLVDYHLVTKATVQLLATRVPFACFGIVSVESLLLLLHVCIIWLIGELF